MIVSNIPYNFPDELSFMREKVEKPRIILLLESNDLIVGQSAPSIALVVRAGEAPGLFLCHHPESLHLLLFVGQSTFNYFNANVDLPPLLELASRLPRASGLQRFR
jgi:hypothetical protein